ncbi:MAG: hypothetical protein U1E66_14280 [Rhodospirillales bacterium]
MTAAEDKANYEEHLRKIQAKMPGRGAAALAWLSRPEVRPLRVSAAVLLMIGGLVGFLPVVGFWMLPLGVLLLAQDVPFLRRFSVWMFNLFERWSERLSAAVRRSWIHRRWQRLFRRSERKPPAALE